MATGYTPPGATCCCGGGSTACCPYGDPPASLCLATGTFPSPGADPLMSNKFFTLTHDPGPGCVWSYDAALSGPDVTISYGGSPCTWRATHITVQAIFDGTGAASVAFDITWTAVVGSGCFTSTAHTSGSIGVGTPAAVSGCLPQTAGGATYLDCIESQLPFCTTPTAPDCTLTTGVCPSDGGDGGDGGGDGFMAVAPRAAASAPAPVARPRICLYAERVEHLAGCGGFRCRHLCMIGVRAPDNPAVPAVYEHLGDSHIVIPADECQECPGHSFYPATGT